MAALLQPLTPDLERIALRINGAACLTRLLRERAQSIEGRDHLSEEALAAICGSLTVPERILNQCEADVDGEVKGMSLADTYLQLHRAADVVGVIYDHASELSDHKDSANGSLNELAGALRALVSEICECEHELKDAIREAL